MDTHTHILFGPKVIVQTEIRNHSKSHVHTAPLPLNQNRVWVSISWATSGKPSFIKAVLTSITTCNGCSWLQSFLHVVRAFLLTESAILVLPGLLECLKRPKYDDVAFKHCPKLIHHSMSLGSMWTSQLTMNKKRSSREREGEEGLPVYLYYLGTLG